MKAERPIFVCGMMRSGTTLLRALIGQHSDVAAGLETFWFDIDTRAGLGRGDEPLSVFMERMSEYFEVPYGELEEIAGQSGSAAEFLDGFMAAFAAREGKTRWAEKTPANILHLDLIFGAWSDPRVVHIIRDPRDVFASFHGGEKYETPVKFLKVWSEYLQSAEKWKAEHAGKSGGFLEIRYEELIEKPVEVMRQVADHLFLPWEDSLAHFEGQSEDFEKVKSYADHYSSTLDRLRQPLLSNRIGVWRKKCGEAVEEELHREADAQGVGEIFRRYELSRERLEALAPTS